MEPCRCVGHNDRPDTDERMNLENMHVRRLALVLAIANDPLLAIEVDGPHRLLHDPQNLLFRRAARASAD